MSLLRKQHVMPFVFLLAGILGLSIFTHVRAQTAPPEPICGNGVVESGEECDDGNTDATDQCDTFGAAPSSRGQCTATFCGDGVVQAQNGENLISGNDASDIKYEMCDRGGRGYCENNTTVSCGSSAECGGAECIFPCTASCGERVIGWSWTDTFGWTVLHPDTCYHLDEAMYPASDNPEDVCINLGDIEYEGLVIDSTEVHNLSGWAWSENVGWICFGVTCNQNLVCVDTDDACDPASFGTFVPDNVPPGVSPDTPTGFWAQVVTDGTSDPSVAGWAKILTDGNAGWISLNCENDGCSSEYETEVISEFFMANGDENNTVLRKTLFGWGWQDSIVTPGFGWMQFNPALSSVTSWLQTRLGDIYAGSGISTRRPAGAYNATFRILSNGNIEALSEQGAGIWLDPRYGQIDFPTPDSGYTNVLGSIDVDGLVCETDFGQQTCENSYGNTVRHFSSISQIDLPQDPNRIILDGGIYYHEGDLTIDRLGIRNADPDTFDNAAGTIVVDGDLIIEDDITYDGGTGSLTRFRNLASIAWIVRGDVIIDPSVRNVVGAFIVLGDGTSCASDGCGRFITGNSSVQFTLSGMVMARQFDFGREGGTSTVGSELIIYDGRLLANIPPGLSAFADALPIWREGTFSR